jgi:hypothetical protein
MTLKTYLFPEVAGHGEITEWVPADVARELLDALNLFVNNSTVQTNHPVTCEIAEDAIKKSCGEL